MPVHPMTAPVVTVQPGMYQSPGLAGIKTETWSNSLFSCCEDLNICCLGFWAPCCLACQISSDFGECLCMPLVDLLTGCTVPAATLALRSAMRERYHIQGSMCDDCCVVTFCTTCAWCQMARELKQRKRLLHSTNTTTLEVHMNPPPHAPGYAAPGYAASGHPQPMPTTLYHASIH